MRTVRLAGPLASCALGVAAACGAGDATSGNGDAGSAGDAISGNGNDGGARGAMSSDAAVFADSSEAGDDEAAMDSGVRETAIAVSTGATTVCALTSSGGVECWGFQLGSAATGTYRSVREPIAGLESGVAAISVGAVSACALTTAGAVECWGDNTNGLLGNDSVDGSSTVPVPVGGLAGAVTAISVGQSSACALTASGAVECWGDNTSGLLGNDSVDGSSTVPVPVSGIASGVTAVSVGQSFACALASGGALCWGSNYPSGLGSNSAASATAVLPMPVTGLGAGVTAIVVGGTSGCALVESGGVQCWGTITQVGTFVSVPDIPLPVTGLSNGATSLAVGGQFACALSASGVQCWGDTPVLGPGFPTYPPVAVAGLPGPVKALSAGPSTACALMASGGIECWGDNSSGQLGNGSAVDWSSVPVAVTGFAGANKP
jgi:alpha-tubulin suppressor-like RCC1 family protein